MENFSDFTRVSFRTVSAALPPGWEQMQGPQGSWVLIHPPVPQGQFRPNLVIRSGNSNGVPLMRIAASGLAETRQAISPLHVLAVDEWPKVFDRHLGQALPGRRHRYLYRADGQTVCVDRWLWVVGAGVVEATASYALQDHTGMKALFEYLVDQLEAEGHGVTHELGMSALVLVAGEKPGPDLFASEQRGTPVEDLSGIAAEQPYEVAGHLLSGPAVELFQSLAGRSGLGRFDLAGHQGAVGELSAAGLVTPQGQVTEAGQLFLRPLARTDGSLAVSARRGGTTTDLQVWIGDGLAMLSAGPSFFDRARTQEGERELLLTSSADAARVLASWAGIGPAWPIQHCPLVIDPGTFESRVDSNAVPAPHGTEAVNRLWQAPWTEWSITHIEANAGFRWLNAGPAGHYSVIPADGGTRLDAQPSSLVWDAIARVVHTAATGVELDLSTDVPSSWLHARAAAGTVAGIG